MFLFAALLLAFPSFAAPETSDRISITEVVGPKDVKVIRAVGRKEEMLHTGENILVGDEILVAPKQIVSLQDYSLSKWKLAPGTHFKAEARKPDKQTLSYWSFQILQGSMWGEVQHGKDVKDGFRLKVRTKTAALGIRGTEYLLDGDNERSGIDVLKGTVWWGKDAEFKPGSYQEVTAGHHAEIGTDGRIVITESKTDIQQLVKDYGLVVENESANKAIHGTLATCKELGKGWMSGSGSDGGECIDKEK